MRFFLYILTVAFLMILLPAIILVSQDEPIKRPYVLTHHMSPEEKARFFLVGKDYVATDPPPGQIWNIAEFEKMEGVLVGYPGNFGISYSLIAALSEETVVTTIVENNNQLNYVTNQYQSHDVNMDNANFLVTALDSYWTRDYGPWYIRYGDDQIGIIDFIYNRPDRPNDNAIPPQMADFLGIEWFGMNLIHTGGNYMTDGYGISASTDLVIDENPGLTLEDIQQMMNDYLGINTYHAVPDPNNTYIDHIDCWGKYLGVDKVMIREVPTSHPQYDEIEATANYFANQVSSWGNNYRVFRVWTPNNEPYTNSLIVNNRVFVPIVGGSWDDEALESYEEAMPGYEILGFTGNWYSTDALHCRTKGIADRNTLYIAHYPLLGEQPVQTDYDIEAVIIAYSGEPVVNEEVKVIYQVNGGNMQEMVMDYEGDKTYTATFADIQEGSEIKYFITAMDAGGFTANHPFIGSYDPHVFYAGEQLFPAIALDITEINVWVNQGQTVTEMFLISNTGDINLSYNIDYSSAILESYEFLVEDSPGQDEWNSNTYNELGWVEFDVDNVVGIIGGWTIDFHWETDNYPQEGTFRVESPDGTEAVLATGLSSGNYTFEIDIFNGEPMHGTWKLWITDSYGDGGHQATDIKVTITKTYTIYPWLTVQPTTGIIEPAGSQEIQVICNGSVMPVGDYEGTIWITSNDPNFTTIEIPVYFTVDIASFNYSETSKELSINNYPNPFTTQTTFDIYLPVSAQVELLIYDFRGQRIGSLVNKKLPEGLHTIQWYGDDVQGRKVNSGVYYYRLRTLDKDIIRKLILIN